MRNKILALLTAGLLGISIIYFKNNPEHILEFRNHSRVNVPANLNEEKRKQLQQDLEKYLRDHTIYSIDEAIRYSLDFVAENLK